MEIIRPLYFSTDSKETDSNTAFEFATEMGALRRSLEKQGFQPEKYLLWSLIAEGGTLDNPDINQEFDTSDGQIENFIRTFKKTESVPDELKDVA